VQTWDKNSARYPYSRRPSAAWNGIAVVDVDELLGI